MKNIRSLFILMVFSFAFSACYKDKGNYEYTPVNELSFSNFDTENGYKTNFGELLTISPQIKGTLDPDGSKNGYTYEWSIQIDGKDSVISTEKILNVRLEVPPGLYTLKLIVKDTASGVQYPVRTQLLLSTKVFEGYMVLNDVNGKSRLDMITYYRTDNVFEQHTDVLAEMNSALPVQGKPLQVYCMETEYFARTPQTYRIYMVTETGTYKIDPETFGYAALNDFKYEMTGQIPTSFMPQGMICILQNGYMPLTFLAEGSNIYRREYGAPTFPYSPVNVYAGAGLPFKAFPQIAAITDKAVIFNMDKRTFTSAPFSSRNVTDMAPASGFPVGKDMVYMEGQASGNSYAVLKDPGTANYYFMKFQPSWPYVYYLDPMNATDIDKAEHFAVSPDLAYLFYSVGGKLYEYDNFLKTSFLMLDKGASKITHISFQRFFNRSVYAKYTEWSKLLILGSYNPAVNEGSNGTLELYSVPAVNAALQLKNSWTGFGKITSVSYRERN